jgi:hypothetical protein
VTIAKNKQSQNAEGLRWAFNMTELLQYERRLYIPSEASVQTELLKHHHDDELTEHFSIEWTLELVSCKYYWLKLVKDVRSMSSHATYVRGWRCLNIIHMTKCRHYLIQIVLKKVIMNMITGLPSSKHSDSVYDVILMIVDPTSRWLNTFLSVRHSLLCN